MINQIRERERQKYLGKNRVRQSIIRIIKKKIRKWKKVEKTARLCQNNAFKYKNEFPFFKYSEATIFLYQKCYNFGSNWGKCLFKIFLVYLKKSDSDLV